MCDQFDRPPTPGNSIDWEEVERLKRGATSQPCVRSVVLSKGQGYKLVTLDPVGGNSTKLAAKGHDATNCSPAKTRVAVGPAHIQSQIWKPATVDFDLRELLITERHKFDLEKFIRSGQTKVQQRTERRRKRGHRGKGSMKQHRIRRRTRDSEEKNLSAVGKKISVVCGQH